MNDCPLSRFPGGLGLPEKWPLKWCVCDDDQPLTRSMQNLLPMRLVLVGASTPVFAGEAVTGLANDFRATPGDAFKDLSDSGDIPSLLEAFDSLSVTAFIGVCSLLFLDRPSCSPAGGDWSEAGLCC